MKLSFSRSKKPSSKQQSNLKPLQPFNSDDKDDKSSVIKPEFVTEFDPSKTLSESKKLIIPPKPNEWRPHKKMRNLELPVKSDDPNLQFEVESASVVDPTDSTISYGLNLRQLENNGKMHSKPESDDPVLQRPASIDGIMLKKLRDDLDKLPADRGFEEFDDVPVEGFGAALLAGYGWYEGRGIGKNAKEDVKVVEYKRWTGKEGLGFVAMVPPPSPPKGGNGVVHKNKEKEDQRNGNFSVGSVVRVVDGRHMGLKGTVLEAKGGSGSVVLRLSRSKEEIVVKTRDVADLGSFEEERCLKKLKIQEKTGGSDRQKGKISSDRKSMRDEASQDRKKDSRSREQLPKNNQVSWLISHIRVRVISKELKGGKLYSKKGKIVDVVGPTTCDISMDESRELIQGVDQELLETALPRRGGPVIVLYGKHKGVYGKLVEKNMDDETGVIQDNDSHSLLNVGLEQIAEFTGDPSSIGY